LGGFQNFLGILLEFSEISILFLEYQEFCSVEYQPPKNNKKKIFYLKKPKLQIIKKFNIPSLEPTTAKYPYILDCFYKILFQYMLCYWRSARTKFIRKKTFVNFVFSSLKITQLNKKQVIFFRQSKLNFFS
jgi:hypothetical protein